MKLVAGVKSMQTELVKVLKKKFDMDAEIDRVDDTLLVTITLKPASVYAAISNSKIEVLHTPDLIEDFEVVATYPLHSDAHTIAQLMCELVR